MKYKCQIAIAALAFAASAAAQSTGSETGRGQHKHGAAGHTQMMGQGMGHGPTAMLTKQDANSAADMGLVMNLVHNNTRIKRTVTQLPDGIRTVTESDDPKVAQDIKAHVASMTGRLKEGREFNIFSSTLPVIFDNAKNIKSVVEMTDKGAIVTRTSTDAKVVAALQAHAGEVTELVQEGPVAFHRGMNARMAMGFGGPRLQTSPAPRTPAAIEHAH
jgi:hypothetical protein